MKKPFIFLFYFVFILNSFSQQKLLSNKKYPFQVLFSGNAIANGFPIKQFDFVNKNAMVATSSELVLIHYSGEVTVLKDTVVDLTIISKAFRNKKTLTRPQIDPNRPYLRRQYGRTYCYFPEPIEVIYPTDFDIIEHPSNLPLVIGWRFNEKVNSTNYGILIQNIFDDSIDTIFTDKNFISIDLSNYELVEGLMIFTVYSMQNPDLRSRSCGVRINNSSNYLKTKYSLILEALENDNKNQLFLANHFYKSSIKQSNQDPRFIKLYEDFLERNPQFKVETE